MHLVAMAAGLNSSCPETAESPEGEIREGAFAPLVPALTYAAQGDRRLLLDRMRAEARPLQLVVTLLSEDGQCSHIGRWADDQIGEMVAQAVREGAAGLLLCRAVAGGARVAVRELQELARPVVAAARASNLNIVDFHIAGRRGLLSLSSLGYLRI